MLDSAEEQLGAELPAQLRALLEETNGVKDENLIEIVWSIERILDENLQLRGRSEFAELYAPFDELIFFGDEGGGDMFAFKAVSPLVGVFMWEHENDERRIIAANLEGYLFDWFSTQGESWYAR